MSKKQSSKKITALYARLSRDDENEDVSGSIKIKEPFLKSMQKIIACLILDSFLMTDTLELPLQDRRSRKFLNLPNKG